VADSSSKHAAPVTVIVLTCDEEQNLGRCLESVTGWASDLYVVDSGSTDRTVEIARRYGAMVVMHPFETHARQWKWALTSLPVSTEWVLALDADQRVTPPLRDEIAAVVTRHRGPRAPAGCYTKRKQMFRGRWIKHGGYYPKYLLKLFRHSAVSVDERDLVDHHFRVSGEILKLCGDLVEENENEARISTWIAKHNRYAALQAREEFEATRAGGGRHTSRALLGSPDDRVEWRKRIWRRLPLYVRPCLYFFHRYVLRLGFLDGKEGFVFHVLQAFWYRLLVDVNLDDLRRAGRVESGPDPAVETGRGVRDANGE
jgi:glycosyltransferase involved in cell wall biosynthesis